MEKSMHNPKDNIAAKDDMDKDLDKTRYLTPNEVAARLMISPVTLRHWALAGKLGFVTTPGGHRRYAEDEIEQFAARYQQTAGLLTRSTNDESMLDVHKILIVADDAHFIELLVALLQALPEPVQIDVAHDGFEAGQKMLSVYPHTVLLDLTIPGFNGVEVCRKIKADPVTEDTRVVVITACHTSAHRSQALAAGAEACLDRPLDKTRLLKTMVLGGADIATAKG